jgi:hypothetical protein
LFANVYSLKHQLGLGIILLPKTNGALEPHDPKRSCPERDAQSFVFVIIAAAALAVIAAHVIAASTLTITVAAPVVTTVVF